MTSASSENNFKQNSKESSARSATKKVEQLSRTVLAHSVATMSEKTLTELAQVRHAALHAARVRKPKLTFAEKILSYVKLPLPRVMITAAVLIIVSVNYHDRQSIPVLPIAMISDAMPYEDLALLEDLEFVTWLAENEKNMEGVGTSKESAVL